MSRTFKTRPGWLQEFQDGELIHDHTSGRCLIESRADARPARRRFHPRDACARWDINTVPCPGHLSCAIAADDLELRRRWAREERNDAVLAGLYRYSEHNPYRCRAPHTAGTYHPDRACGACEDRESAPTCTYHLRGGYVAIQVAYGAGVDADFRRAYEGRARSRTRDVLAAARRDYNSNGDTDLSPEPTRHRHEAHWRYW